MLLALTVLATTSMRSSTNEEKMSHNMQNKEFSFQAAEAALREAENWIINLPQTPIMVNVCVTKPCVMTPEAATESDLLNDQWWSLYATESSQSLTYVAEKPKYIVQFLNFVPDTALLDSSQPGTYYYRITARSKGGTNTAVTLLQSIVSVRY